MKRWTRSSREWQGKKRARESRGLFLEVANSFLMLRTRGDIERLRHPVNEVRLAVLHVTEEADRSIVARLEIDIEEHDAPGGKA